MKRHTLKSAAPFLALSVLATMVWLYAGDLNPPAGPVAPTLKTLDEVEPRTPISSLPFTIDTSGSYYLTQSLAGSTGITIDVDDVTLDLNGFSLTGVDPSGHGINVTTAPTGRVNVTIQNGTVRDWDLTGVNAGDATNSQVLDLHIQGNREGLSLGQGKVVRCTVSDSEFNGITAFDSTITRCTARGNGVTGIIVSNGRITDCLARSNLVGIDGRQGSIITGCIAEQNTTGITGAFVTAGGAPGVTIRNCAAAVNVGEGIVVGENSLVAGNKCELNIADATGFGIHVTGSGNRIEGNTVIGNNRGVKVDVAGNYIVGNSASGNTPNFDIAGGNTAVSNVEF